jgi:hypothetical protein
MDTIQQPIPSMHDGPRCDVQDEKIHGLSVAHSLGPVSVALAYGKVDSLNGVTNNDGEAIVFRTNVNF